MLDKQEDDDGKGDDDSIIILIIIVGCSCIGIFVFFIFVICCIRCSKKRQFKARNKKIEKFMSKKSIVNNASNANSINFAQSNKETTVTNIIKVNDSENENENKNEKQSAVTLSDTSIGRKNTNNDNLDTRLEGEKGDGPKDTSSSLVVGSSQDVNVELVDVSNNVHLESESMVNQIESNQMVTGNKKHFVKNLENQVFIENNVLMDDIVHHIDTHKG